MKFAFVAAHRSIWPVAWQCSALGASRSGFQAWLNRPPSARAVADEKIAPQVRSSFLASDRIYGARRVWHDVLAAGLRCGLHKVERLMRAQALRARPRRRGLPKDHGQRHPGSIPPTILDQQVAATVGGHSSGPPGKTKNGWPISPLSGRPRAGSWSRW